MRYFKVIEIVIRIIIILKTIDSIHSYDNNYCESICANFTYCYKMCSEKVKNSSLDSISLPHCGLALLNKTFGINYHVATRIINGKESQVYKHPWMVSIQTRGAVSVSQPSLRPHTCGGAIINSRFILTAAHCCVFGNFEGAYKLQIGSNSINESETNGILLRPEKMYLDTTIIMHEEFKFDRKNFSMFPLNDICLMKTSKPIEFSIKGNAFAVNSICLPEKNSEQYGEAMLVGWGNVNPEYNESDFSTAKKAENLREDVNMLLDKHTCSVIHKSITPESPDWSYQNISNVNIFDNETMICTIYKASRIQTHGTSSGDSGSPVIQYESDRAYAIGLVSGSDSPAVSRQMQISKYIDWIADTINKYS